MNTPTHSSRPTLTHTGRKVCCLALLLDSHNNALQEAVKDTATRPRRVMHRLQWTWNHWQLHRPAKYVLCHCSARYCRQVCLIGGQCGNTSFVVSTIACVHQQDGVHPHTELMLSGAKWKVREGVKMLTTRRSTFWIVCTQAAYTHAGRGRGKVRRAGVPATYASMTMFLLTAVLSVT